MSSPKSFIGDQLSLIPAFPPEADQPPAGAGMTGQRRSDEDFN